MRFAVWRRSLAAFLTLGLVVSAWLPSGVITASASTVPTLLITELVPDSTDVGESDGFEYVEVYNNTNQPIDFGEYMVVYHYPEPGNVLYWRPYESVIIPPQQALVLWGMTPDQLTVNDFNANYGTNLVENETIVRIPGGMNQLRERTIGVATSSGHEIVTASYNKGVVDTSPDMGIVYTYPDPGSIEMKMVSSKVVRATPGSVDPSLVPAQPVIVAPDTVPPVVADLTSASAPDLSKPIEFVAQASDDQLLTSVVLHYKSSNDEDYKTAHIARGTDGLFRYSLPYTEWYGSVFIDYYFRASDGTNKSETSPVRLPLVNNSNILTMNVKDGDVLSGEKVIIGSGNGISYEELTLSVEGIGPKFGLLGSTAYFTFEADGIDAGQNAVTLNGEIIEIIPLNTTGYKTVAIPVSTELIKYNQVNTFAIQAGSGKRPYYEQAPEGNLDDYNIRNVRLILEDGTVLRDPQYASPTLVFDMGDNGRFLPIVYFNFEIPESKWVEKSPTEKAMDQPAYFVLEANGIDSGETAITIGREVLGIIPHGTTNFSTVVFPVDPTLLSASVPNRFAIRAGSVNRPYWEDAPEDGLDDFDIRNVRLVLSDGTVLRDPRYEPTLRFDMGDNGRFLPIVYFDFTVPEDSWNAVAYRWNTGNSADGQHRVSLTATDGQLVTADVFVDNNGPIVTTNIEDGQEYKGIFTIQADAFDTVSPIASIELSLDGNSIHAPYTTSSAELKPGVHTLAIRATDAAGHTTEHVVSFTTPEEHPLAPQVVSPVNGETDVDTDAELRVKVEDPTGDLLEKVTFYKGDRIKAASEQVQIFTNAVDREPPLTIQSPGDTLLSTEQQALLAASDDEYVTTDSVEQFPYHRFEVEVGSEVGQGDRIEIVWEGNSLPGRKVSLYAWNYNTGEWQSIASMVAPSAEDFTLAAAVDAADFVSEGKVQALVQDLIPGPEDYDYTFVAIPDTQIYAEILPEYFRSQVEWIRDNKEAMNIRYVAHMGDIVNSAAIEGQWLRADQFMSVLEDADIPYGVVAGNHDVFDGGADSVPDYSKFSEYFGEARFADKPYYGGSYKDNRGHYDLISVGGTDYIFVYMGWGVQDDEEGLAWMNKVLKQYPDRKGILILHDYIRNNAARSATGDVVYNEVVVPNPNVYMVIAGHYTGSALRTDAIDDDGDGIADRQVHQMLNDYQGITDGGLGYMKLFHFDTDTDQIYVNTYSPMLDDYNYYDPSKDEWTLAFDLDPQMKRVATDRFEVGIYTDEVIGSAGQAASGETVQSTWSGLEGSKTYHWYAVAEDSYGGRSVSELSSFRTRLVVPAPSGLQAASVEATSAMISWNPAVPSEGSVTAYHLYINGAMTATVTESVYRMEGLVPDTVYTVTIAAVHETGITSAQSAPLAVQTLINFSALKETLDTLIASGEVNHPAAVQLTNALKQAEHHKEKGHNDQAVKSLQDFLKHLQNKALSSLVTDSAKQILIDKVTKLIQLWSNP